MTFVTTRHSQPAHGRHQKRTVCSAASASPCPCTGSPRWIPHQATTHPQQPRPRQDSAHMRRCEGVCVASHGCRAAVACVMVVVNGAVDESGGRASGSASTRTRCAIAVRRCSRRLVGVEEQRRVRRTLRVDDLPEPPCQPRTRHRNNNGQHPVISRATTDHGQE